MSGMGKVNPVFISGFNSGAGLSFDTFSDRFLSGSSFENLVSTGRISVGVRANNTLENAIETQCWLKIHPEIVSVGLVTSERHMKRAHLALRRALSDRIEIHPVPVPDPANSVDQPDHKGVSDYLTDYRLFLNNETVKYLGTWLFTLLPTAWWPLQSIPVCE